MDHSPLGKLPGELRNYVFALVMGERSTFAIEPPGFFDKDKVKATKRDPRKMRCANRVNQKDFLSLMRTCKELLMEASSFFYGTNTFSFRWTSKSYMGHSRLQHLDLFKKVIGKANGKAIRRVIIEISTAKDSIGETVEQLLWRSKVDKQCALSMQIGSGLTIDMKRFTQSCEQAVQRLSNGPSVYGSAVETELRHCLWKFGGD